jgi:hypothetical protein
MMGVDADDIIAFFQALPTDVRAEIDVLAERDRTSGEDVDEEDP